MNATSPSISAGRNKVPAAPAPVTGLSLLLAVLLVLCLAGLSVLSLSTAQTNYSRSLQLQQRRDAWFNACNQANRIAAEIDQRLDQAQRSGSEADFSGLDLSCDEDRISYLVPVDDRQVLFVELQLTQADSEYNYRITVWQLVTAARREETGMQLMNLTGGGQ